jgi:Kef-type K+ transport system membrane component KefB
MDVVFDKIIHIRSVMITHPLFVLGMLLVVGYFIGKLAEKIKLPEITGYLVAGLLMGHTMVGVVSLKMGHSLNIITEVALGFIALTIGGEFHWSKLKRMGKDVVVITIFQIVASFGLVTLGLWLAGMDLVFASLLGAIASATAPAATVAIVQSLRAKGKFIDYLYGIVALDDAGAVILFGVIFAFASTVLGGSSGAGPGKIVLFAFLEVFLSIILGIIIGSLIHLLTRKMKSPNEILLLALGFIFLSISIATKYHLSPLLTNMAVGAVLINLSTKNHRVFKSLERLSPPIYALFFVIAGTELQPSILAQGPILLLGTIYIVTRAIGKYGGVYIGCTVSKLKPAITRNLGFCMLPQAGVALGLVLLIQTSPMRAALPPKQAAIVDSMVNIVLFSVFINEMIGPPISRYAIIKGNEMDIK